MILPRMTAPPRTAKRLGIVDLGSNTARLVVYTYEQERWFRLEDEIREPVRLAEGFGKSSKLTNSAMKRCYDALALIDDYRRATGLQHLEVIGTSAIREAENRQELLERIRDLKLEVKVLSEREEAELGVRAVANGLPLRDAWVVDLGGGSLEISLMRVRAFDRGESLPLGMVRMTERFLSEEDPPRNKQVSVYEGHLQKVLAPIVEQMRELPLPVVAMGGTARNLARAIQKRERYPLALLHGYECSRASLEELVEQKLLGRTARQRAAVSGISADRADVILAGALLYRWLLRATDREGFTLSGHGLREGALYRHLLPHPHLKPDVRGFSIGNLQARYSEGPPHSRHVRHLAREAFRQLAPLHGLSTREEDVLDAAAALHDVGMALSFYRHARHGVYLLGSQPLAGFSHKEQAMVMLLVRYHEKGTPRISSFKGLLGPDDLTVLRQLTACLRLAEHLERSRSGRVEDLKVKKIGRKKVRIRLKSQIQPSLEIWAAQKLAGPLFRVAFDRKLVLEHDPCGRAPELDQ